MVTMPWTGIGRTIAVTKRDSKRSRLGFWPDSLISVHEGTDLGAEYVCLY